MLGNVSPRVSDRKPGLRVVIVCINPVDVKSCYQCNKTTTWRVGSLMRKIVASKLYNRSLKPEVVAGCKGVYRL